MVACKLNEGPHEIIDGPDFPDYISRIDPRITTTVSFNSLFDNSILAWRYGWVPRRMLDAMGMARALLGHLLPDASLRTVAHVMGLGQKGHALQNMMGKRREQIIAEGLWPSFCQYALQDNYLCEQIFLQLYPQFPKAERELMDMVLRCTVEPKFQCDVPMLEQHLEDVQAAKQKLLEDANDIDPKVIMSTPKFKEALEARGVTVEMKVSPTTGKETPAFAKTDEFMETLQDHADPVVAAMAAARLALKSTLEETRTEKFISIAQLPWPHGKQMMPMPLRYGGAHTHRLSGEWKMNPQNMPTVRGSKGKSKLRKSLVVGEDEIVVTCDLAQIEARLVAWICGDFTLIQEFAKYTAGDKSFDPYNRLASAIFGRPVNRKLTGTLDEIMGFIGKTGILGLGYGAGKDRFDTMVIQSARAQGTDISQIYNRQIGDTAVDTYRGRYARIPAGWRTLDQAIQTAWLSGAGVFRFGPCEISYGMVTLPNGLALRYADPGCRMGEDGRTEYVYRFGKFYHTIYGAKLLENIVQALARIVVMNAALRIRARGLTTINPDDYRFVLQAHDELVYVVKKVHLDEAKKIILDEMRRPPSWAPTAPIDAELNFGASYGDAK
jgi:DNA polymerase